MSILSVRLENGCDFLHFGGCCRPYPSNRINTVIIRTLTLQPPRIHYGFYEENTFSSFDTLELLIQGDDRGQHKGKAYLWLMKALSGHSDSVPLQTHFSKFTNTLDLVSEDLHSRGDDCRKFLFNSSIFICLIKHF